MRAPEFGTAFPGLVVSFSQPVLRPIEKSRKFLINDKATLHYLQFLRKQKKLGLKVWEFSFSYPFISM
jgi:hypothetical protein